MLCKMYNVFNYNHTVSHLQHTHTHTHTCACIFFSIFFSDSLNKFNLFLHFVGFPCGNETCVLVQETGQFSQSVSAIARRMSDGGQQWKTTPIKGDEDALSTIALSQSDICFSGTSCPFGDNCRAVLSCFDATSGTQSWALPPARETVGGAGYSLSAIPSYARSKGGFIVASTNNVSPGQQQKSSVQGKNMQSGTAWITFLEPGTGHAFFNKTYPQSSITANILLPNGLYLIQHGPRSPPLQKSMSQSVVEVIDINTLESKWSKPVITSGFPTPAWLFLNGTIPVLLFVTGHNASAIDPETGNVKWSSVGLGGFGLLSYTSPPIAIWTGDILINSKDGADGNSNTQIAVSLVDGSELWKFPATTGDVEVFTWSIDCTFDPTDDEVKHGTIDGPSSTGVCFVDYSCMSKGSNTPCPSSVRVPGSGPCGGTLSSCRAALDLQTGKFLYTLSVAGIPRDVSPSVPLFRYGSLVIFDGSETKGGTVSLLAMDVRTGKVVWTVMCSSCASGGLMTFHAPKLSCVPTLKNLCGAAKQEGVAQCGLCAGEHASALHAAGCTDSDISSWCSSSKLLSLKSNATSTLLAASENSQSGGPAIVAIDPLSGEQLWSVDLKTKASKVSNDTLTRDGWTVTPFLLDSHGDSGISVYISGTYAESEENNEEEEIVQPPPPPPPTFYSYYVWDVESMTPNL
eukprot:m.13506 g.13506  ORF g.13506 m.13506 type:complete len:686 (+) comp4869_c0_seq1:20-2077(+)